MIIWSAYNKLMCLKRKKFKIIMITEKINIRHSTFINNLRKQATMREAVQLSENFILLEKTGMGINSHLKSDISLLEIMIINNVKNKDNRLSDYQKIILLSS